MNKKMNFSEFLEDIKISSPRAYQKMAALLTHTSFREFRVLTENYEKDPIGTKELLIGLAEQIKNKEKVDREKQKKTWALSLASDLENLVDSLYGSKAGTTSKVAKTLAVVVGANKGVWMFGMLAASTFGVASTGTAISALSGAAFTSASLAWLGLGSAATGTAFLGAAAFGVGLFVKKRAFSKSRNRDDFTRAETQIDEAATGLAIGLRNFFNNGSADMPLYRELVRRDSIVPIVNSLGEVKKSHLGFFQKQRLNKSIKRLRAFAETLTKGAKKYPNFTGGLFVPVFLSLMVQNTPAKGSDEYLVIEALKRSNKSLQSATDEEICSYVSELDEEQLDGLLNNVKGIYHEMLFVSRENSDGDNVRAELFKTTNHSGADIILEDLETGEIEEIQLKATDYINYVKSHQKKYPEIPVVATEEVSASIDGVDTSGFSNQEITEDVKEVLSSLNVMDNKIFENSEGVAVLIYAVLHAKTIFKSDRTRIENLKMGKEAATVAFAAYLSSAIL